MLLAILYKRGQDYNSVIANNLMRSMPTDSLSERQNDRESQVGASLLTDSKGDIVMTGPRDGMLSND